MSQNANKGRTCLATGRIVWVKGDLFKGQQKRDFNTKQLVFDDTGKPKTEWGFGLAIPKSSLQEQGPGKGGEVWSALHEEAFTLFPSRQIPPGFAMKYKDGDGIDDKGRLFSLRDGYAGCIVLACTSNLQVKFYRKEGNDHFQITEGIKCGDYVDVALNIKAHPGKGTAKAGLYVNPVMVRFLGYGKEIINTPDAGSIFGEMTPMPAGASATPIGGGAFPATPQQFGNQQMAQPSQPGLGTPYGFQGQAAPQPQQAPVDPHYGILPTQFQQQAPQPVYNPNALQGAPAAIPSMQPPQPTFAQSAPVVPGSVPMPPQYRG